MNRIVTLYFLQSAQGKRFGRQLLEYAKMQYPELILSDYKDNKSAYKFYLSQGFQVTGERKDEFTSHIEYTVHADGHLER